VGGIWGDWTFADASARLDIRNPARLSRAT
jgi:hypothetical protein